MRILFLAFLAGVLSASSFYGAATAGSDLVALAATGLLGAACAAGAVFLVVLSFKAERPVLILSASGADFRDAGLGLVPWEDIASVHVTYAPRLGAMLAFRFHAPKRSHRTPKGGRPRAAVTPRPELVKVPFGTASVSVDKALAYAKSFGIPEQIP